MVRLDEKIGAGIYKGISFDSLVIRKFELIGNKFIVKIDESIFRFDGVDELELRQSRIFEGLESFEVLTTDGGENGVIGRDHVGELFDLTSNVGAHFANKVIELTM